MKKIKKISSILFSSAIALTSIATIASCATKAQDTNGSNASEPFMTPANATVYSTISFIKRGEVDFQYIGRTQVKVKNGLPFGTVTPPQVVCDGYTFEGWTDGTKEITNLTIISGNMEVSPILEKIPTDLEITGSKVQYDGFSVDNHEYTLQGAEPEEDNIVTWSVWDLEEEHQSDALILTPNTEPTKTNKVIAIPKHTLVATSVYLCASYNGSTTKYKVDIKPAYYREGTFTAHVFDGGFTEDTKTIEVGDAYWFSTDIEGKQWMAIHKSEICSTASKLNCFVLGMQLYDSELQKWNPYPVVFEFDRTSCEHIANATDAFPGLNVNEIGDNFMANVANFNATLNGGVDKYGNPKVLNKIGNSFLSGCTSFNQNISDVFTFEDNGLIIGDDFMEGCTAFNNGYTDEVNNFVLPYAQKYGNAFMIGCTGLKQNIVLPKTIWSIGSDFMFECSSVKKITIPSTCTKLKKVAERFMIGCNSLTDVVIDTENINYFVEVVNPTVAKGSFLKLIYDVKPSELVTLTVDGNDAAVAQFYDAFIEVNECADPMVPGQINGYYRIYQMVFKEWNFAEGEYESVLPPYEGEITEATDDQATHLYYQELTKNPNIFYDDLLKSLNDYTIRLQGGDVTVTRGDVSCEVSNISEKQVTIPDSNKTIKVIDLDLDLNYNLSYSIDKGVDEPIIRTAQFTAKLEHIKYSGEWQSGAESFMFQPFYMNIVDQRTIYDCLKTDTEWTLTAHGTINNNGTVTDLNYESLNSATMPEFGAWLAGIGNLMAYTRIYSNHLKNVSGPRETIPVEMTYDNDGFPHGQYLSAALSSAKIETSKIYSASFQYGCQFGGHSTLAPSFFVKPSSDYQFSPHGEELSKVLKSFEWYIGGQKLVSGTHYESSPLVDLGGGNTIPAGSAYSLTPAGEELLTSGATVEFKMIFNNTFYNVGDFSFNFFEI